MALCDTEEANERLSLLRMAANIGTFQTQGQEMVRECVRYLLATIVFMLAGSNLSPAQEFVSLPELSTKRLLNDLQIIVAPTPYLDDSMAIGLVVRYGSAFDAANKGGVANFLSRMFLKATVDRTSADIREELAYLGATLDVTSDWDGFRFVLKGNSASYERALLLLYQVVCEARFTEEDVLAVKRELLDELRQTPDPRTRLLELFEKILFRGTTYGRSQEGIPEIVATITPGDLRYFYRKHFSPGDASLLVVGNVPSEEVLQKATRIWGIWIRKDRIPFTFAPAREPSEDIHLIEDVPDSAAVQFIMGNFSPRRSNPLFGNVMVAASILRDRLRVLLPTWPGGRRGGCRTGPENPKCRRGDEAGSGFCRRISRYTKSDNPGIRQRTEDYRRIVSHHAGFGTVPSWKQLRIHFS